MNILDIIEKKKSSCELNMEEISYFVHGFSHNTIPDYQASALLMAICLKGFSAQETYILTKCMIESGETISYGQLGNIVVDKHSTGGVGDSVTLVLMPMLAATQGISVAKMSGRGLGHTGGTIDKLESIKGFKTCIDKLTFIDNVKLHNIAIISQLDNICIADKKLYALRDVTATVDSIPLIAASIMSKKIACGADFILLDVKYGKGAFMKDLKSARKLADVMVELGRLFNKRVISAISDMNSPLADCIGNKLEVIESINILKNIKKDSRLYNLCIEYYAIIVSEVMCISLDKARELGADIIKNNKAYEKMERLISLQGGDITNITIDTNIYEYKAEKDGYITSINALTLGKLVVLLGGGRIKKDDIINYDVGVEVKKHIGDRVSVGDTLCVLYHKDYDINKAQLREIFTISDKKPRSRPLIDCVIK